jgi:hypothetical protein
MAANAVLRNAENIVTPIYCWLCLSARALRERNAFEECIIGQESPGAQILAAVDEEFLAG